MSCKGVCIIRYINLPYFEIAIAVVERLIAFAQLANTLKVENSETARGRHRILKKNWQRMANKNGGSLAFCSMRICLCTIGLWRKEQQVDFIGWLHS